MLTEYTQQFKVKLAGDSIWDCKLETVTVNKIIVEDFTDDDDESMHGHKTIWVEHDGGEGSWRIYTDSGFEEAISAELMLEVHFTEQGMQQDGTASMEA